MANFMETVVCNIRKEEVALAQIRLGLTSHTFILTAW